MPRFTLSGSGRPSGRLCEGLTPVSRCCTYSWCLNPSTFSSNSRLIPFGPSWRNQWPLHLISVNHGTRPWKHLVSSSSYLSLFHNNNGGIFTVRTTGQKWKVQDVKLRDLTSGITFCNDKQPVCQGGASDVYQGQYDGKIVALKQPRFRTLSLKDIESTTRVSKAWLVSII